MGCIHVSICHVRPASPPIRHLTSSHGLAIGNRNGNEHDLALLYHSQQLGSLVDVHSRGQVRQGRGSLPSSLGVPSEPEVVGERIDRRDALVRLLGSTGRGGVPLRSAFVQRKTYGPDGTRKGPLSAFTGDAPALEAYLLIHAMASSSSPYETSYPAITWAHVSDMTRNAEDESARQRWSKAVQKLKKLKLIDAARDGRGAKYTLLHESGNGQPYTRPKQLESTGGWVPFPYSYWLDGFDRSLSLPEKIMLIVSLDQKEPFELPSPSIPKWYGIPEATGKRGLGGLAKKGILAVDKRSEFRLKAAIHLRTVNVYSTTGVWAKSARVDAMTLQRTAQGRPVFVPSPTETATAEVADE